MRGFCPFAVTFMGTRTMPVLPRVCLAVPSVNAIPTTDTPEHGKGHTASHCIRYASFSRMSGKIGMDRWLLAHADASGMWVEMGCFLAKSPFFSTVLTLTHLE